MASVLTLLVLFPTAPHNASQPSPAGFDLGSNSIGPASATASQGILPTLNQSGAVGGSQAPPNAVGGMPRPILPPPQQQNSMASIPINNAQLAGSNNPPSAATGQPVPPGAMNRGPGAAHNAAMQSQQQAAGSAAAGARNIRGAIADSASNIEHIVRCSFSFVLFILFNNTIWCCLADESSQHHNVTWRATAESSHCRPCSGIERVASIGFSRSAESPGPETCPGHLSNPRSAGYAG